MTPEIRTPIASAGAAAALARATELLLGGKLPADDGDLLPDGRLDSPAGALAAVDVAIGAGALLAKIVLDAEAVLNVNRGETLHLLGLWIAAQEVPDGQ